MQIAVVGTGYVGLVSAACFAELGHAVIGIDIDAEKIRRLQNGECPIYEPGLLELIQRNAKEGRLSFSTDIDDALAHASVLFSAVATPPGEGHKADLKAVFSVLKTVAERMERDIVFVNKSTVPVGTGKKCEERAAAILAKRDVPHTLSVISNPEFLREGMAVTDTLMPDRIIVGINGNAQAEEQMEELYRPITRVGRPLVRMSRESAEIVKYASNAFLATKISFINMMSALAEISGADIRDIAKGMGLDERIGPRFLHAGIGYGGSCFPKDVKALMQTAKEYGIPMPIVEATDAINTFQRNRFTQKMLRALPAGATVAVWGLSFKPKTDDMREAPSIDIIRALLDAGHSVRAYDPAAMSAAKMILPSVVRYCKNHLDAAQGADAVAVLTEWDVFRGVEWAQVRAAMNGTTVFDGRNIYEPADIEEAGMAYVGIGIGGGVSPVTMDA